MLSLKQIFAIYNLETNFEEFVKLDKVKSMVSGFGGSGGQIRDYVFKDGMHHIGGKFLNNPNESYLLSCDTYFFAIHFCTPQQWEIIEFLREWSQCY